MANHLYIVLGVSGFNGFSCDFLYITKLAKMNKAQTVIYKLFKYE